MTNGQLSEEELAKLQEIHELINLMFSEMPVRAQGTVQPFAMPIFSAAPYQQQFYPAPWASAPFLGRPGF
jgi:hypothetical protein